MEHLIARFGILLVQNKQQKGKKSPNRNQASEYERNNVSVCLISLGKISFHWKLLVFKKYIFQLKSINSVLGLLKIPLGDVAVVFLY